MTRKTVYTCDTCSASYSSDNSMTSFIGFRQETIHVCDRCKFKIVKRAFLNQGWPNKPLRPFCSACKGTGFVKEVVENSGDYYRPDRKADVACSLCDLGT